jgi:hypothetical protein
MLTEEYMRAARQERLLEATEIQRENEARALLETGSSPPRRFSLMRSVRIPLPAIPFNWVSSLGGALRKA